MGTLILTQADVASVVTMDAAVSAIEQAFAVHGRGEALMPPKVYLSLPKHEGDFRAMPSYMDGAAGVKWVNAHPNNPSRHKLPTVMALYLLSDPETAKPLAVMDGTLLTAIRTGAAAAVASKHLARKAPKTIGFIGAGVQARWLFQAHRVVYGDSFEVISADLDRTAADRFAHEVSGRRGTIEEASRCDVVCTATPSRTPVVRRTWVAKGAHVNAMGADAPGKQELEASILLDAKVVIDDAHQATESGEINVALHDGTMKRDHIYGTLGEIVAGKKAGRGSDDEITVFDSTGLAIQDLALARVIYAAAKARGLGRDVDFFA
jgi:alanine dehydrogenase